MKPIPIWLLTGYLGAGKTTVLNHLLGSEDFASGKLAVVINEFGPMGLDGKLLREGDFARYEINRGSLFCACTTVDLMAAFSEIAELAPRRVCVEATGVAETGDIEKILATPDLAERFCVGANVCVIDAVRFTKVAPMMRAARIQAASADALVINKADQASAAELQAVGRLLDELNPHAPRTVVSHGQVDWGFLRGVTHKPAEQRLAERPPADLAAATVKLPGPVSRKAFADALATLGDSLLRLKGQVDFDGELRFVEAVGTDVYEDAPKPALPAEPAFTVIARGLTAGQIAAAFDRLAPA